MTLVKENDYIRGLSDITEKHSCDITPGLISLNLGIVNTLDLNVIEEAKLDAINAIEDGHPILHNVENNIIALLQTKIPHERHIARQTLENIINENPNHLNALADLEHIYRDLNRVADANCCRDSIAKVLAGTSDDHKESRRVSLLEQGYAIEMEKDIINANTVDSKMSMLQTVVTTELKNSSGERKNYLAKSLYHSKQMKQYLQDARKHRTLSEHIFRTNSSIQKFETVLTLFPEKELHAVWNFNFAISLNEYCDLIESMSRKDKIDRTDTIKKVTIRAIKLFWKTVETSDQDMSLYVARSYAFIGHIITRRKQYLLEDQQISADLLSIPNINEILKTPSIVLDKAFCLKPCDIKVLNRYGRSLWNESQFLKDQNKLKVLKQAEEILSKSIESENKRNWFAYSSRLIVRRDIANSISQREISSKVKYFELAREDGLRCFSFKGNLKDMTFLAEVCQSLAKCPDFLNYGPKYVKSINRKYLIEAIDYLYYGMQLGDPIEYYSTSRMASCLADFGEISKAIEWQKRAWLLSMSDSTYPVVHLCIFLTISIEEESRKAIQQIDYLLKDFLYVLKRAKDQYSSNKNNMIYAFLYKRRHKHVLNACVSSIHELSPFDNKTKTVIADYLNHVINISTLSRSERNNTEEVMNLLSQEITVEDGEENFNGLFESKTMKPSTSIQSMSSDYEYDFFVCHSHKDGEWVNSILLPHLENAYKEDDFTLKGCIADRDFQPGMSIMKNIIQAFKGSSKIILILTCDFLDSYWCQYEIEQALIDGSKQRRVIPVRYKACELPDELKHLTYIDLTDNDDIFPGLQRIKNAIL